MFKNRLEEIKALHDEANQKASSNAYDDIDRVKDILQELFQEEHTDWLIEQAEKVEGLETRLKELSQSNYCIICGDNATEVREGKFYCEDCSK